MTVRRVCNPGSVKRCPLFRRVVPPSQRYSAGMLRLLAVETAPCFGCHRMKVRVDLQECQRCHRFVCDRCTSQCFCSALQRVDAAARTLG